MAARMALRVARSARGIRSLQAGATYSHVRRYTRRMMSSGSSGIPKGLDTSNPFEIKFHLDKEAPSTLADGTTKVTTPADVAESFDEEINIFHTEMESVFGSEPEEFRDDENSQSPTSSSSTTPKKSDSMSSATFAAWSSSSTPVQTHSSAPEPMPSCTSSEPPMQPPFRAVSQVATSTLLFIQGPCTYVQGGWVGSRDRWSLDQVETLVVRAAISQGVTVAHHHSNHEGDILDWILGSPPGAKIILNWTGRLEHSPAIFRALSTVQATVVVVAPRDVEVGPLPLSVKGVVSGFGTRSLELAIQAAIME